MGSSPWTSCVKGLRRLEMIACACLPKTHRFAARAAALQERAAGVEQRLARAFAFVEASFGDAQEMVVFTTELTSRTSSARYIAQDGSQSYFAHNHDMILSDRQRELRRRVEDLDV